jgi:hypothetical protein
MKLILIFLIIFSSALSFASDAQVRVTTMYDEHYGQHERQIFDIWMPKSSTRTPLVIYIHGGGWVMGSKDEARTNPIIKKYNAAGVAFAAINYRFLKHAALQNIMREDIAGFVQFIRYNARKFNIDKNLIMAHGFSAGGSASLWLGTHDDIARPSDSNRMLRESSRVLAIGHLSSQVSYDFIDWFDFFGKENVEKFLGEQIWTRYHLKSLDDLYTPIGEAIRQDLDSYENMGPDDAPMILWNTLPDIESETNSHFMHSPRHAKLLKQRALEVGLEARMLLDGDQELKYDPWGESYKFFMEKIAEAREKGLDRSHCLFKLCF